MRKVLIFLLVFFMLPVFSANASYNDISGHWAEETINNATSMGLISGNPDGSFSPDTPITLAEILAMLVPLVSGERPEITDEENWYVPYADKAFELGLMEGFVPEEMEGFYNAPAIRMIANTVFSNALIVLDLANMPRLSEGNIEKARLGLKSFKDADELMADMYTLSSYICVAHGIVKGNHIRELMPYRYMTRAEAVAMLFRIKTYQVQRLNGMNYLDPFKYKDFYFTCIKTPAGELYPIADAGRPVITDDGVVYMTTEGVVKILEACEKEFTVHMVQPETVYDGFFENYIAISVNDFYGYTITDESMYGYSDKYRGYIEGPKGKRYSFVCDASSSTDIVVRNTPMLPVKDVLDYFDISYNGIIALEEKASVYVDFTTK